MGKILVPSVYSEFMQAFRSADYEQMNILRDRVKTYYEKLMKEMVEGTIDYFYYYTGSSLYAFTRSSKKENCIQRTCFWNRKGELIALSDTEFTDVKEAERKDLFADGVTIYYKKL